MPGFEPWRDVVAAADGALQRGDLAMMRARLPALRRAMRGETKDRIAEIEGRLATAARDRATSVLAAYDAASLAERCRLVADGADADLETSRNDQGAWLIPPLTPRLRDRAVRDSAPALVAADAGKSPAATAGWLAVKHLVGADPEGESLARSRAVLGPLAAAALPKILAPASQRAVLAELYGQGKLIESWPLLTLARVEIPSAGGAVWTLAVPEELEGSVASATESRQTTASYIGDNPEHIAWKKRLAELEAEKAGHDQIASLNSDHTTYRTVEVEVREDGKKKKKKEKQPVVDEAKRARYEAARARSSEVASRIRSHKEAEPDERVRLTVTYPEEWQTWTGTLTRPVTVDGAGVALRAEQRRPVDALRFVRTPGAAVAKIPPQDDWKTERDVRALVRKALDGELPELLAAQLAEPLQRHATQAMERTALAGGLDARTAAEERAWAAYWIAAAPPPEGPALPVPALAEAAPRIARALALAAEPVAPPPAPPPPGWAWSSGRDGRGPYADLRLAAAEQRLRPAPGGGWAGETTIRKGFWRASRVEELAEVRTRLPEADSSAIRAEQLPALPAEDARAFAAFIASRLPPGTQVRVERDGGGSRLSIGP